MARSKQIQPNIDNSDIANYPNSRIRDNDGSNNGTPVNEEVYGDIHEFFAKLMRLSGLNYNNIPDNETNGYQYIEALKRLTTKNDLVYQLTNDVNGLVINFDLNILQIGEYLICKTTVPYVAQTVIKGGTISRPLLNIYPFVVNDYLILRKNNTDVELLNLNAFKPVTNAEEEAGLATQKFTTPVSNSFVFTKKVNGALSVNFLAKPTGDPDARNGLISAADKLKLNNTPSYVNVGWISGLDVRGSVGPLAVSGNIVSAVSSTYSSDGSKIAVTMQNAMANTDYLVKMYIQSMSPNLFFDDNVYTPVFRIVSTTQFDIGVAEGGGDVQNLKIHIEVQQL